MQFIPKNGGLPASGKIEEDRTFSLKSKTGEGAAPGEYKVRLEPSVELLTRKGRLTPKLPFASKYREYDGETGLMSTVRSEATQLEPFRFGRQVTSDCRWECCHAYPCAALSQLWPQRPPCWAPAE